MLESKKATGTIVALGVAVLTSLLLSFVHVAFLGLGVGILIGFAGTALIVKWSMESMLTGTMDRVDEMEDSLADMDREFDE